ncbi:hypothetical protein Pst134EA_025504 [Puccinia striiformis f. sp. tritici]|uniref:hypothetical protein n=1 Tax=Puccinia striiformis f. sp. tritici TaxID=168172 RepID=UPI002007443F|nr:hypothetical protein Pst134EA_025504 [Puccinia striiformis f. sp. tritici]KAH9451555.1 hypothetical protein Pst134EA_025504 [Puccinia striiformis f. sp. tritici]
MGLARSFPRCLVPPYLLGYNKLFSDRISISIHTTSHAPRHETKSRMFLCTRTLVVCAALLAIVTGTTTSHPSVRLTRRMIPEVENGKLFKSSEGTGLFGRLDLESCMPGPGEDRLSLLGFHTAAMKKLGFEPNYMDQFVDHFASMHPGDESDLARFTLKELCRQHLEWMKTHKTRWFSPSSWVKYKRVSSGLSKIWREDSQVKAGISWNEYISVISNKKPSLVEEAKEFVSWNQIREWKTKHGDTVEFKLPYLLENFLNWAKEDPPLGKKNLYVCMWGEDNKQNILGLARDALFEFEDLKVKPLKPLWKRVFERSINRLKKIFKIHHN